VAMAAGAIAFTDTPFIDNSSANDLVKASRAAFYAA